MVVVGGAIWQLRSAQMINAFLVRGAASLLESEPPQALMAIRAAMVITRVVARGEIFIDPTQLLVIGATIHPASTGAINQLSTSVVFCARHHRLASLP